MKKFISAAFVVAMAAASCTNLVDINDVPQSVGDVTFSAEFKEPASKATPDYNEQNRTVNILWEQGDKVGVYDKDGAPIEYSAVTAGATTTLTGSAAAGAATYYAMFPYDANATIASGVISTALPAEQVAAKDRFTAHLAVASTTGTSFNFMNVCGLVRVYVGCAHVTKIEFKGNNDEVVAGQVSVTAATAAYTAGAETSKVVTVSPAEGLEAFEAGAYYFSVLPQTFANGFTVTAYLADGSKDVRTVNGSVTIPRSSLVVGKPFADITGTGTEADPFIIKTVHDLCNLSGVLSLENPNYVELAADIDMAYITEWTPISNTRTAEETPEIHLDGKTYSIINFGPTSCIAGADGTKQAGLFGTFYGSCKNLNFVNVKMSSTNDTAGVLAGFLGVTGKEQTKVSHVNLSGTVSGKKVLGGLCGKITNALVENCSTSLTLSSTESEVGGFAGRLESDVKFVRCVATGEINGARGAGCFIGGSNTTSNSAVNSGTIEFVECAATGNVTGTYQMGAFIGHIHTEKVTMTNCYATGNVKTTGTKEGQAKQIGGLVGVNSGAALAIDGCYYIGKIEGGYIETGGFLGLNATGSAKISNTFAIVDMPCHASKSKQNGGIIGHSKATSADVSNCYIAGTITSLTPVGAFVGLAATATSFKNCKHNTNLDVLFGSETVAATQENNAKLSETEVAEYATASKIATKLGWSTDVWNLTGDAPTLKCFDK